MTNRKLLELAAKAANHNGKYMEHFYTEHLSRTGIYSDEDGMWNPLTDDGDALRLAVKLHINLRFEQELSGWGVEAGSCGEDCKPNPYVAARLAIVKAAAEIGRTIQ